MSDDWIEDGFGSCWPRCGEHCMREIVRPGKSQCVCDNPSSLIGDLKQMSAALLEVIEQRGECPICNQDQEFHYRDTYFRSDPNCPLRWWT